MTSAYLFGSARPAQRRRRPRRRLRVERPADPQWQRRVDLAAALQSRDAADLGLRRRQPERLRADPARPSTSTPSRTTNSIRTRAQPVDRADRRLGARAVQSGRDPDQIGDQRKRPRHNGAQTAASDAATTSPSPSGSSGAGSRRSGRRSHRDGDARRQGPDGDGRRFAVDFAGDMFEADEDRAELKAMLSSATGSCPIAAFSLSGTQAVPSGFRTGPRKRDRVRAAARRWRQAARR